MPAVLAQILRSTNEKNAKKSHDFSHAGESLDFRIILMFRWNLLQLLPELANRLPGLQEPGHLPELQPQVLRERLPLPPAFLFAQNR